MGGRKSAGFECWHGQVDEQPSTQSRGRHLRGWRMLTGDRRCADLPAQLSWQLFAKPSCSPQGEQTGCEGLEKRRVRILGRTVHASAREHRDSDWSAKQDVFLRHSSNRECGCSLAPNRAILLTTWAAGPP